MTRGVPGLYSVDFRVLHALREGFWRTADEIGAAASGRKARYFAESVPRSLERLEERGFVARDDSSPPLWFQTDDGVVLDARVTEELAPDPVHVRANLLARQAVKTGKLTKPDACSGCGRTDRMIEMHHDHYRKPLEVRWLCRVCHRDADEVRRAQDAVTAGTATRWQKEFLDLPVCRACGVRIFDRRRRYCDRHQRS